MNIREFEEVIDKQILCIDFEKGLRVSGYLYTLNQDSETNIMELDSGMVILQGPASLRLSMR